jgi:hypothetical protein
MKRDATRTDVEGLFYVNSGGARVPVSVGRVESLEERADGVVVVKFYGYFTRNRYDAWDGYVYRVRWAARKPGGKWFVDERRRDALSRMENWCPVHRRDRGICECEKEAT